MEYHGFGYIVDSCPLNETEQTAAASRLNCGVDEYSNSQYVCAPNAQRTAIVEYCYKSTVGLQSAGTCLKVYNDGSYDAVNCTSFIKGCTTDYFLSADLYKYPACHQINTKDRCYYEDPACPKINNDTTVSVSSTPTSLSNGTDGTWDYSIVTTNSASRDLPNSTETALNYTIGTTVQSDDNVMKAVLTGSFAGVLLLVLAIVLLLFLCLRTKNKDAKIMQSEEEIPELQRFIPDSELHHSTVLIGTNEVFNDGNGDEDYFNERRSLKPSFIDFKDSERRQRILGDYSVWKTSLSDQFSLSDDEVFVLFSFLCSDSGTPDFTDTDCLGILNVIRRKVYDKGRVTSEEAQRTLDGLKSRGFLWAQDGVHLSEDVEDETMYRVTGRATDMYRVIAKEHAALLSNVYVFSSYTTAVRYLRSRGYTRKSGEKCVISDDPDCDSLLIRRLQMNILTHVTMEDTEIYNKVSQLLNIPENIVCMGDEERGAFLEELKQTGERVQYRGGSQGGEQHVKWLWGLYDNERPDIVRSCIGLHTHWDIYIINNTAYRKHSKYHEYPEDVRCRLYSLLFADQYTVNVKDHSYQDVLKKIRDRYYTELDLLYDEACMRNLPCDIVHARGDAITLKSEGIRHDVMYAFLTECLVKDSDLKFFLTTASRDVISEYCRLWDYKRSERCLYIPYEMYDLFIDRLQLDILTHCTVSDWRIHNSISKRLGVPREVLRWGLEARKRYVEYAKRGTQTVHHARGMIVGCAGAGKTTLLKRLLRCSDSEIRDVTSTEGLEVHEEVFKICIETKRLKARAKAIDNKNTIGDDEMTVTFFDFGGQCAYYACHQIYLTRRAFYMLVVDASKHLNEKVDRTVCDQDGSVFSEWTYRDYFVFWMKSIHTYCGTEKDIGEPEPEVIIVATHWDKNVYENNKDGLITSLQNQFRTNSTLGTRYIRDDNIFLTSFSQDPPLEILSDLEKYIFDIVCQKRWAEKIPKEWAFMEVEIPKTKSTKRIERTRAISSMMPEKNAVYDMLRYYHDAGKILYFHETALRELIIIDVQWFVDAFKNIITDKLHRRGIKASLDDWNEYYQTGHLKECLLTEIWIKKDSDLQKELLEKGKAAIQYDISKDPGYLLPHKNEILMFMNRLGLIAVGKESHYVPCMNRDEIDKELANNIYKSKSRTSILIFQFDILPYFFFYQLVVASMLDGNWKVLKSKKKPCLYKNAALFFSTDHHIALSVTETTIQLQVYLPSTDGNLDVNKTRHIQMVIEDKLKEITSSSRRGKGYIRGFICGKGIDQPTITANTDNFISETDIAKIHGDKITCPLHGGADHHYIYKTEMTKYWETSISSN